MCSAELAEVTAPARMARSRMATSRRGRARMTISDSPSCRAAAGRGGQPGAEGAGNLTRSAQRFEIADGRIINPSQHLGTTESMTPDAAEAPLVESGVHRASKKVSRGVERISEMPTGTGDGALAVDDLLVRRGKQILHPFATSAT